MTAQPAAAAKTERLLNLVIALLSTRMPLSKARIRTAVPQYAATASDEAFDRMFERDKDELRELGIPLATAVIDPVFDDELGYRIDKREYALPEIAFEPDEVAALVLASRTWTRASLADSATTALRKLRSAGVQIDDSSMVGIEPVVRTTEPAFDPVRRALVDRQAVRFTYRKADGQAAERQLQPWGLAQWHGRWYVTGHDLVRDAPRVFRLSRVQGAVVRQGRVGAYQPPADHDARAMVESSQQTSAPTRTATVRVAPGAGNTLRRRATSATELGDGPAGSDGSDGSIGSTVSTGGTVLTVHYRDTGRLADELAGFGPDAVALDPPELQQAVVRRLRGVLEPPDRNTHGDTRDGAS